MFQGRKLILCLLLCLAMVLPVCCLAQGEAPVLGKIGMDRVRVENIPGLKYTDLSEDGMLHLLIDTDGTNWSKVMLNSGATTEILLSAYITSPDEEATLHTSITGNRWENEEQILHQLVSSTSYNHGTSGVGRPIAAYTDEKEILSPLQTNRGSNTFIHGIHWTNEAGDRHWYEYMTIEFEHSSWLGQKVGQLKYDESLLTLNTNHMPGVTSATSEGAVTYTFDPASLSNIEDNNKVIETRLKAPQGAKKLVARSEYGSRFETNVDGSGYATLRSDLIGYTGTSWQLRTGIYTDRTSILWLDNEGKTVEESGVLSVTLINADTKLPWMAYLSEYTKKDAYKDIPWNPAAITRSDVLYGYEQDDRLVDVDYFTADIDATYAHVHTRLRSDLEITLQAAQEMSWCGVTYQVKPPENAKYVSTCRYTRNNFYGFQQQAYDSAIESLMEEDKEELYSTEYPYMRNCNLFEPLSTPIEEVMLFSTVPETKPDRAGAYFFCWFDADKKPISISYFIETADRIVLEPETESYLTEVDVKHPVKGPVFIDGKNTGWKLRAEYHVQSGYNAYIVDLHIEDSHGNPVDLKKELGTGEKIVFYLPYREHDDFSKYNFFLTHYEGGDLNNGVPVQVTPTDKGIRFEVDNLSPFVVSWDDASLPPAMSTQLPNFIVETEQLREPTEALIDAGFPTDEAIDEAVSAQLAGALPARGFMDVIEFVPKVRIEDGTWIEIENPDEMPDDGLYCEFAYPEGTSAATHDFVFFHMLGADSDEGKVGDIVPVPFEEKADYILLHMRSFSPVGYGYVETPASPIPQTGDATPLWLYFSILTLSAGCILILRRKHA